MRIDGLAIDDASPVPVYRQIADGILAAVTAGRLEPGAKLPPTRDLARQLGVNRNTVVAAYDLLASEGRVQSRTGRGTFLVRDGRPRTVDEPAGASGVWFTGFSRAVEGAALGRLRTIYRLAISDEGISFAGTYPAAELLPVEAFRAAMDDALRAGGAEALAYGPTAGFPALRESIATRMRGAGSPARADAVVVTNGAQQAIDLVFRTMLDLGDTVVLEDPTYTGALSSLGSIGARMVGVPLDEDGMRTDLLALALERHRPRLIYVQPTLQNPTTRVMSEARRRELLALAERYRCVVVEDDWAADLHFDGDAPPTLHALDGGRRVIYLSTFSKKLLPGLRVGWVAAPPEVTERLIQLKQVQDFGTSPVIQAGLQRFLERGGLADHLRRVLPAYRERRDAMLDALRRHMPGGVRWARPAGGLFVWIELPAGMSSDELFVAARDRGVLFSRGELFQVEGSGAGTLRLAYGGASPEEIGTGVEVLASVMKKKWPEGSSDRSESPSEAVPIL